MRSSAFEVHVIKLVFTTTINLFSWFCPKWADNVVVLRLVIVEFIEILLLISLLVIETLALAEFEVDGSALGDKQQSSFE
jgi:hypothetical protein